MTAECNTANSVLATAGRCGSKLYLPKYIPRHMHRSLREAGIESFEIVSLSLWCGIASGMHGSVLHTLPIRGAKIN